MINENNDLKTVVAFFVVFLPFKVCVCLFV